MRRSNLLFLVVALVAISAVRGEFIVNLYSNEFSVASPSDNVKICSCGMRVDSFEITNVGNVDSTFSVSTESSIGQWITLSAGSFSLKAGEKKMITAGIAVPCGKTGVWSYVLHVKTNFGREKTITKPVVTGQCQNIKGLLTYYRTTVNPCESAEYDLVIENVGTFAETYDVSLDGFDSYAKYSEKQVTILPGEKKTVFIAVQLSCERYGSLNLPFRIHAVNNDVDQHIYQDLTINKGYDFSLEGAETQEVCSRVVSKIPIKIRNNAGMSNEYRLSFSGPSFASVRTKPVVLSPGEETVLDVVMNPAISDEGRKTVSLVAVSKLGGITKTKDISLDVLHCYDHAVSVSPEFEKACCGKKTYVILVENNGLYEETFSLKMKASVWTQLSEDELTLGSGESMEVLVEVDVPCIDDQFEIRIIAEAKSTGITSDDVMTISSLTRESCTRIDVLNDVLDVKYDTQGELLRVRNAGIRDAVYSISYDSAFFTSSAKTVSLHAGEEKSILLTPQNITTYFKGVYLDDVRFTTEDNILYNETVRINLGERSLVERFYTHLTSSSVCMVSFLVFVIGAILALCLIFIRQLLVVFKPENKVLYYRRMPHSKGRIWQLFFILLLIFASLFVIGVIATSEKEYVPVERPLYIEMYPGTENVVNLTSYFEDPDSDSLSYSSNYPENIAVDFNGPIATIRPDDNFFGERQLKFIADDGKGGKTESATVTVKVLQKERLTFGKYLYRHCPIVFVVLLFAVWLVAFAFYAKKGKVVWYYRARR